MGAHKAAKKASQTARQTYKCNNAPKETTVQEEARKTSVKSDKEIREIDTNAKPAANGSSSSIAQQRSSLEQAAAEPDVTSGIESAKNQVATAPTADTLGDVNTDEKGNGIEAAKNQAATEPEADPLAGIAEKDCEIESAKHQATTDPEA